MHHCLQATGQEKNPVMLPFEDEGSDNTEWRATLNALGVLQILHK